MLFRFSLLAQTAVVFDAAPIGKRFGQVLTNVNTTPYHAGDAVRVQFVGANPRVSRLLLSLSVGMGVGGGLASMA